MTTRDFLLATAISGNILSCATQSSSHWWNQEWRARIRIEVSAEGVNRSNKPVEVPVDFSSFLEQAGLEGSLDEISLRLMEVDKKNVVVDDMVPFQFEKDGDYHPASNASGRLVFICTNTTQSAEKRTYDLYFDTVENSGGRTPARIETMVEVTDKIKHEGQESFKIATPAATYYYHKAGAGFASMEDKHGVDWIGYRPGFESGGEYRGIPNLWKFHPGQDSCISKVDIRGPIRARIRSLSLDGKWECIWDIFPDHARMSLLKINDTYWFLYEGIPGGSLEVDRDYNVLSTGLRRSIAEDWHGDIPAPEWVYFGDDRIQRVLYLVHHEDDTHSDQFWQMRGEMVVFGFGREYKCCGTYMDRVPACFTVGFAEDSVFFRVESQINNVRRPLSVWLGTAERLQE